ncbi:hypothetical protein [Streptomyces himalayensis]|uniref:hypothetical protein n=1 Tax=Streptomyces himalayensis TaxID=2820085 RepID=UPI00215DBF17|nr:hypothetical protein [Streptomyces himalayensis]
MYRVKPSRRQIKKLTAFEKKTSWRYSITATSIRHMWGIAGSHQIQFLDALHRDHAEVEDGIRTGKAVLRLLPLHNSEDLANAEPDTMRFRLCHLPARLARQARRRYLRIERTWPWASAFTTSWRRLTQLPAVT